jgi:exodeoxyribonuclease X
MADLIRVIDFETSDDSQEMAPIEVGWTDVSVDGQISLPQAMIIAPHRPISPEAMAVHHISQAEADAGIPDLSWLEPVLAPPNGDQIIGFLAHSVETERTLMNATKDPRVAAIRWACSYKSSVVAWPDMPKHSNQVLRYAVNADKGGLKFDQALGLPAHRAGPDSYVTAQIVRALLQVMSFDQMVEITGKPVLYPKVPFGKWKGKPWPEVPADYFHWVRRQPEFSADFIYCMEEEEKRRRGHASAWAPAVNTAANTQSVIQARTAGWDVTPLDVTALQPTETPAQEDFLNKPAATFPPTPPAAVAPETPVPANTGTGSANPEQTVVLESSPLRQGFRRIFYTPAVSPTTEGEPTAAPSPVT